MVLVGTALSTTMPITLLITSASCFIRYGIDRGYFLLRVYQKPAPIDGTLVKFCVRLHLPMPPLQLPPCLFTFSRMHAYA